MIFDLLKALGLFYLILTLFRYIYHNFIIKNYNCKGHIDDDNANNPESRLNSCAKSKSGQHRRRTQQDYEQQKDKGSIEEYKINRSIRFVVISSSQPISYRAPNLHINSNAISQANPVSVNLEIRVENRSCLQSIDSTTHVVPIANVLTEISTLVKKAVPAHVSATAKKRRRQQLENVELRNPKIHIINDCDDDQQQQQQRYFRYNKKKKPRSNTIHLFAQPKLENFPAPPPCILVMTKGDNCLYDHRMTTMDPQQNQKPFLTFEVERHSSGSNNFSPISTYDNVSRAESGQKMATGPTDRQIFQPIIESAANKKSDSFCKTSKSESPFKVSSNSAFRPINRAPSAERDQSLALAFNFGSQNLHPPSFAYDSNGHTSGHFNGRPVHKILDLGDMKTVFPFNGPAETVPNVKLYKNGKIAAPSKAKSTNPNFASNSNSKCLNLQNSSSSSSPFSLSSAVNRNSLSTSFVDSIRGKFKIKPVQYSPNFDHQEHQHLQTDTASADKKTSSRNFHAAKMQKSHTVGESETKPLLSLYGGCLNNFEEKTNKPEKNEAAAKANVFAIAEKSRWPVKLRNTFALTHKNYDDRQKDDQEQREEDDKKEKPLKLNQHQQKFYARKHKTISIHQNLDSDYTSFLGNDASKGKIIKGREKDDAAASLSSWAFRQQISPAVIGKKFWEEKQQQQQRFTFDEPKVRFQMDSDEKDNFKIAKSEKPVGKLPDSAAAIDKTILFFSSDCGDNSGDNSTTGNVTAKTKLFEHIAESKKKQQNNQNITWENSALYFNKSCQPGRSSSGTGHRKSDRSLTVNILSPDFGPPNAGHSFNFSSPPLVVTNHTSDRIDFVDEYDGEDDDDHHEDKSSKMTISEKTRLFEIKSKKSGDSIEHEQQSNRPGQQQKRAHRRKTQPVTQSEVNKARSLIRRSVVDKADHLRPFLEDDDNPTEDSIENLSQISSNRVINKSNLADTNFIGRNGLDRSKSSTKIQSQLAKCKKVFLWS